MNETLTSAEKQFIEYWDKNRLKEKRLMKQLLIGLPVGIVFSVPILLNLFLRWDKRVDLIINTGQLNPTVLLIAFLLIVVFVAVFSMKHKWEMKEQYYRELIAKGDESQRLNEDLQQ